MSGQTSKAMAVDETMDTGGNFALPEKGWTDKLQQAEARNAAQLLVIIVQTVAIVALVTLFIWVTVVRPPPAYVLRVDQNNDVTYGGPLVSEPLEGDETIPMQLTRFVENWRSVTPDNLMQKRNVRRLYCMVRSTTPAQQRLNEYFRDGENDPFQRNREFSIMTKARSISKLGGNTWQAEWYETKRTHEGEQVGERQTMKATMIVERGTPETGCLEGNPLGIYVSDINWGSVR